MWCGLGSIGHALIPGVSAEGQARAIGLGINRSGPSRVQLAFCILEICRSGDAEEMLQANFQGYFAFLGELSCGDLCDSFDSTSSAKAIDARLSTNAVKPKPETQRPKQTFDFSRLKPSSTEC